MKPALHAEIEQAFLQTNDDLHTIVVLDAIEELDGESGFRIRSHDLYGPLPHLSIEGQKDRHVVLKKVRRAACRLAAIVYIRDELARHTGLSFFHHPTIETTPAEVDALLAGYRQLREHAMALLSDPEPRPC